MRAPAAAASAWTPLVTGEAAAPVWGLLGRLERVVRERASPFPGIAGGDAGAALFLYYLAKAKGEPVPALEVERRMEHAVERCLRAPTLGFLDGLAGVGWTIAHLWPRRPPRVLAEVLRGLDDQVLHTLKARSEAVHYELGRGLVGFGVYALERQGTASGRLILEQVLRALDHRLLWRGSKALLWTGPDFLGPHQRTVAPEGLVDLGVAHGIAGALHTAGEGWRRGVAREAAARIFKGLSRTLAAELRKAPASRGGLPYFIGDPSPGRLAWCYGPLGAAGVLLHAARSFRNPGLAALATRELPQLMPDCPLSRTVLNLSLCHGAGGALLVHMRASHRARTASQALRGAARAWLWEILRRASQEKKIGQIHPWIDSPAVGRPSKRVSPSGFLEGAGGLGLALLAAVSNQTPHWDRALLLSSARP